MKIIVTVVVIVVVLVLVVPYLAMQTLTGEDSSTPAATAAPGFLRLPPAAPAGQFVLFGKVKTLTRKGSRLELRFDPALWLGGITGQRAAVDDGVLRPGEPVPNDNYTRDESHKLLRFKMPAAAQATILTNEGTKGLSSTRVPVSELSQIIAGKNPKHRKLFGSPKGFGFWARVAIDTVRSLDEQYHP
jgi:hypothetical protein